MPLHSLRALDLGHDGSSNEVDQRPAGFLHHRGDDSAAHAGDAAGRCSDAAILRVPHTEGDFGAGGAAFCSSDNSPTSASDCTVTESKSARANVRWVGRVIA